jgi:hypothetical protein
MPVIITVIFYGYTTVSGKNYLWADIVSFLFAISVGQCISYRLFVSNNLNVSVQWLGILAIMGMAMAFVFFTYIPPHLFIFEHVQTHEYGILSQY